MRDNRTKRQKLQDMANQSASPNEAEIARQKLTEIKEEIKSSPSFKIFINGVEIERVENIIKFNDIFFDFREIK
jgi:hypothetical protein